MYFESHAHYDDRRFDKDRDVLLGDTLKKAGIDYIVNIGSDLQSSIKTVELVNKYDYIYGAVGTHPHAASEMKDEDLDFYENLYRENEKIVAIGEIGLDFYYDNSPRDIQIKRFEDQLAVAGKLKAPIVVHTRNAGDITYEIIKKNMENVKSCVIHCFTDGPEMASKYVEMGFYIGVGGITTYKNAEEVERTVEITPLENILIETDSPYLSPVPNRGKRNDSQNLKYICEKIGQIKQISPVAVAEKTRENALSFFKIK